MLANNCMRMPVSELMNLIKAKEARNAPPKPRMTPRQNNSRAKGAVALLTLIWASDQHLQLASSPYQSRNCAQA